MSDINLLIVEDEDSQLATYLDAIEEYNETSENNVIPEVRKRASDCIELLKSSDFDAAIVDLNLEGDHAEGASGNDVLLEIRQSHRFPIFVLTGTPDRLDPRIEENIFLKVFERTSLDNADLLKKIEEIFETGITSILGARGKLEELVQKIFWVHISDGFEYWLGKNSEDALLRYSINHLTEYLNLSETYFEPEYYITPPIKDVIATGDIVRNADERYIVMNPACDLEPRGGEGDNIVRNSKNVILVKILNFNEETLKSEGHLEPDRNLNADRIKNYVKNNKGQFSFLPSYSNIDCGIIDFGTIRTIPLDSYSDFSRLATISAPFLKDIQGRYSQYYGRQGQPDLNVDEIVKELTGG